MRIGHVLKILTTGGADGIFIQIGDEKIPAETAVKVWEALESDVTHKYQMEIPEEKKKPAAEKKHRKRVELDDGKILALRKAGWSLAKIADEMGVSQQTISNHLEAMKDTGKDTEEAAEA